MSDSDSPPQIQLRRPIHGDGLRKSLSCEPLVGGQSSATARISGGVSLASLTRSLDKSSLHGKAVSDAGSDRDSDSFDFQIGSYGDGDVFVSEENPRSSVEEKTALSQPLAPVKHNDQQLATPSKSIIDPQSVYHATSCIFVANLPNQYTDEVLESELTRAFGMYGTVFIKIRRQNDKMPFAFAQYTSPDHAQDALRGAQGLTILGRGIRTEMAEANTTFVVFKKSGLPIAKTEAENLLKHLGEISKVEDLAEVLRETMGYPPAVVVHYKMYDDSRDPVKVFRCNPTFEVVAFNIKKARSSWETLPPEPIFPHQRNFMKDYDKDRRSAYVGYLPRSFDKERLRQLAQPYGNVHDVDIRQKTNVNGDVVHRYAYIEFEEFSSVDRCAIAMNGQRIEECNLLVERKRPKCMTPNRPRMPGNYGSRNYPPGNYSSGGFSGGFSGRFSGSLGRLSGNGGNRWSGWSSTRRGEPDYPSSPTPHSGGIGASNRTSASGCSDVSHMGDAASSPEAMEQPYTEEASANAARVGGHEQLATTVSRADGNEAMRAPPPPRIPAPAYPVQYIPSYNGWGYPLPQVPPMAAMPPAAPGHQPGPPSFITPHVSPGMPGLANIPNMPYGGYPPQWYHQPPAPPVYGDMFHGVSVLLSPGGMTHPSASISDSGSCDPITEEPGQEHDQNQRSGDRPRRRRDIDNDNTSGR